MQKYVICPNCGLTVGEQIGGKLFLGTAGYLIAGKLSPLVALAATLAGIWFGHKYFDSAIRKCPQCGTLIQIAGGLI